MAAAKKKTVRKKTTSSKAKAWTELKDKYSSLPPEVYSVRGSYRAETIIDHPTFGLGVVTDSFPSKIEVCFEDGVKTLMHRREA